jgi:hypothetical protein
VIDFSDRPVREARLDPQSPIVFVSATHLGAEIGSGRKPGVIDRAKFDSGPARVHHFSGGAAGDELGGELPRGPLRVECLFAFGAIWQPPLDVVARTIAGVSSPDSHGSPELRWAVENSIPRVGRYANVDDRRSDAR